MDEFCGTDMPSNIDIKRKKMWRKDTFRVDWNLLGRPMASPSCQVDEMDRT